MRRRLAGVVLVVAIGLPGCGSGADDVTRPTPAPEQQDQATQAAEAARAEARRAAQAARRKRLAGQFRRALRLALVPQEGKSRDQQLRIAGAVDRLAQLAKEDLRVVAPLLRALEKRDYELITKLQFFYVRLGKPGSEKVLLDALYRAGATPTGTGLALTYLQSGNRKLVSATRKWAAREGFTISGSPGAAVGSQWGCLGVYRARRRSSTPTAPPTGLEC
jgi:hypothetical protein